MLKYNWINLGEIQDIEGQNLVIFGAGRGT
jgi:hypothetical protein